MGDYIEYEWCIGKFKGDMAANVLANAGAGIGYFIRSSSGRGQSLEVEAAFRRAKDSPTPEHLTVADNFQTEKLEKLWITRHPQGSAAIDNRNH